MACFRGGRLEQTPVRLTTRGLFSKEQILVKISERFLRDPLSVIADVRTFFNLPQWLETDIPDVQNEHIRSDRDQYPMLPREARTELRDLYAFF